PRYQEPPQQGSGLGFQTPRSFGAAGRWQVGRTVGDGELQYKYRTGPCHAGLLLHSFSSPPCPVLPSVCLASPRLSLRPGAVSLLAAEHSLSISPALCPVASARSLPRLPVRTSAPYSCSSDKQWPRRRCPSENWTLTAKCSLISAQPVDAWHRSLYLYTFTPVTMHFLHSGVLAVVATLAAVAQGDYSIDPDSVPLSTRRLMPNRGLVPERADHLPHHLPADGAPEDACQHMRSRDTHIRLPVRQQPAAQCVRVHPDAALLCLPGMGQPVRQGVRQRQQVRLGLPREAPCGATDPKKYTSTASTSTPTATTTDANTIFTAPGGGSGSSSDKKGAAVALEVGQAYGLVMVMAGLFAGFALL
ncbi:hypothetical protein ACCO45_006581, partial [Purpureocillium lilacinum]